MSRNPVFLFAYLTFRVQSAKVRSSNTSKPGKYMAMSAATDILESHSRPTLRAGVIAMIMGISDLRM